MKTKLLIYLAIIVSAIIICSCDNGSGGSDSSPVSPDYRAHRFKDRTYEVDIKPENDPKSSKYDPSRDTKLLFVFHGYSGSGANMQASINIGKVAMTKDYIVIYPDSYSAGWNNKSACTPNTGDDIGFIKWLVEKKCEEYNIGESEVYAAGFSSGAHIINSLLFYYPGIFKKAAPVAGLLERYYTGKSTNRTPMIIIHGANDSSVPVGGWPEGRCPHVSVWEAADFWAKHNGCSETPTESTEVVGNYTLNIYDFDSPDGAGDVKLVIGDGISHRWVDIAGISYSSMIIKFFEK